MTGVAIGKVIKSNAHVDYVCQVYGPGEVARPPAPEEFALGTWVGMPAGSGEDSTAVGLVYDTQLYNPDYGSFGPRLSNPSQLEVFSPDYLNETATLLGVLVVGQMREGERVASGYCPVAPQVGAPVSRLSDEEVRSFHAKGAELELAYYGLILAMPNPILSSLLLHVLGDLERLLPEHERTLRALGTNLSWRTRVDLAR